MTDDSIPTKEILSNSENYKFCFIPDCNNTTITTPQKVFLNVLRNLLKRKAWSEAVGNTEKKIKTMHHCYHPEIPQRTGKIFDLEKFDALFFGVHFKQAHTMDPMCRCLLEHAYESIIDAGVNVHDVHGSKMGVFVGACFSESEKTWFYEKLQVNGFGITGCSRAMLANRISYWLGVTGPSYSVDTACSSSLFAMEHAYQAIRRGQCDSALVGGCNLCLHPYVSLQFSRLGVLSVDGRCKTFDDAANGYVRSEAIAMVFLQRAKDAKRIYATVVHAKTNCDGYKEQGITFPSSHMQATLLKEFYEEIELSPLVLDYIEAHGTGTKVGDPEEVNALDKEFCTGRKDPLLLGSIKSNLGHSEPASGLCSIAKVVLAMNTGIIPPNLHFKTPRKGVAALEEGRLQVVTEPTPWNCRYVGVNSFGFGGANAHILLKWNTKEKISQGQPNDDLPRLVTASGRTEEAVATILNDVESRPVDVEYIRLWHDISSSEIRGHIYRGYTIVPSHGLIKHQMREIESSAGIKRPVWFVFSGMGSQWSGMGEALMRLPVFSRAIKKCDAVLRPHGLNIVNIIMNKDKKIFENILNSFVGIAAVQIGLVDVLHSVGIQPDNIIGHSVGELGCAYADGCFTAEQMILSAYSRGLASVETKFVYGSMAAVGLGYRDLKEMVPVDIEIACHNSAESATISGPAEPMKAFIAKLQANNIFVKEVPCSHIPYHSRYIASAGPKLLDYLQKIIPSPKPRSSKWLSTSVPQSKWDTVAARLSSAQYHTNNLLSPVLFEETLTLIPKNAVVIEIAPHGLLQAILRRSLAPTVINIPLTKRGCIDNIEVLLQGLGKMYNFGLQPKLDKLYPHVAYPVSRTTPMISPLIKWEHSEDWYVTSYKSQEKILTGERTVIISLADENCEYISGHMIDGRNLYPATGYLALVWETIGLMRGEMYFSVNVVFEDVKFLRATTVPKTGNVSLHVMVQKGTGRFEVVEGNAAIVTGYIRVIENPAYEKVKPGLLVPSNEEEIIETRDMYKELKLRGYNYSNLFRSVYSATHDGSKGHIIWKKNWVAFMDNMLQLQILALDTRGLFVPTGITKMVIDTTIHNKQTRKEEDDKDIILPIIFNKTLGVISSGGVEIRGMKASAIQRRKPTGEPVLEEYKFVAHFDRAQSTLTEITRFSIHIALEHHLTSVVKTIELLEENDQISIEQLLSPYIKECLGDIPLIQADINIVGKNITFDANALPSNISVDDVKKLVNDGSSLVAAGHKLLTSNRLGNLNALKANVKDGGFIITREDIKDSNIIEKIAQEKDLYVIMEKIVNNELFVLMRKQMKPKKANLVIHVNNDQFDWIDEMRITMKEVHKKENSATTRIIYVSQGEFENGLTGFINCIRREPGGEIARGILIQDPHAPQFSLEEPFYKKELQKDLAMLVLRKNSGWGSYRHLPLPPVVPKLVRHAWANQTSRGDLSSLKWLEGPLPSDENDDNLVNVAYSSINFRDIMLATGKLAVEIVDKNRLTQDCVLGFEFCGVTTKGKRVMGMLASRGMTNLCVSDPNLIWEIPDNWSLEDAATVPAVYGTCYYALYSSVKMKKGEKVLIHAGSGGVGQAAINLALYEGCEVFTTVGTPEKRQFIRDKFPQIKDNHIGNSRDTSFEQLIIQQTNGRGVDIVLNSLAEEKLQASVRCLAKGGHFLEIGKFDMAANSPLGMECFLKEISFHGIMLDNLFHATEDVKRELTDLVQQGLTNGAIKPLTRVVFPKDKLEAAFRYMAAGKHIGKVIIQIRNENELPNDLIMALPRFHCFKEYSYIIFGGLGGFGLELADWLVIRGCRKLVLISRVGLRNGYQKMIIKRWENYGVKVIIVSGKQGWKEDDCRSIIETAMKLGPVDAIFNLAVVLKDAIWENQTPESFQESFKSKAWTTKHLDKLTRKLCPKMRKFVVFSSVSCGRGNAGQTNYGMSNSVMERICERRVADGLPALAIQWGAVGDVGLVADMQEDNKEIVIGGTLQQRITSCLHELDGFLNQNAAVVSSIVVAEKKSSSHWFSSVVDTVLDIMGLKDIKTISLQTSLAELGMDSMMAVEIKQTLEREFEIFLSPQDIRSLNFAKLREFDDSDNQNKEKKIDDTLQGVNIFISLLNNTTLCTEECIRLESLTETEGVETFIIPGIEGLYPIFSSTAAKVKAPTYCLLFPNIVDTYPSISELREKMLMHIIEKSKTRRSFNIVGYSYGSIIAIELVKKLEDQGLSGRLTLIDGSPQFLLKIIEQHLSHKSTEELQNNLLLGVIDNFMPVLSSEFLIQLEKLPTWNTKLQCLKDLALKHSEATDKLVKNIPLITGIYHRLLSIINYNIPSDLRLKTPIILLKAKTAAVRDIAEDYEIGKFSDKFEVYSLDGNHLSILENSKVAMAVNGEPLEDALDFKNELMQGNSTKPTVL